MKKWIGFIGFFLFVGMAVVGVKFILQAEQSAAKIEHTLPPTQANRIQDISLSPPVSGSQMVNDDVSDENNTASPTPSNGKDATIVRGEFAYRASQPEVSVILKNEASFPIQRVHISLFLRLNGEKNNVAETLGVPVELAQPLAQGESVRVNVPVSGAEWSAENVAQAQARQVLVQIASVSTTEADAASEIVVDYPQTSGLALIKQTANDWLMPHSPADSTSPEPDDEDETPTETEQPDISQSPEPEKETDVVQQILDEQKVPQHPLGVISYEEKTLKK